jgi:hypothetical protein
MMGNNNFKAIETLYAGCRFRSRLESRWAVFFDTLGIQWEYEKEGFVLEGIKYLPDFWLPEQDCWVEIKGQSPTGDELEKARLLALYTQKQVSVMYGPVEVPPEHLLNSNVFFPPTLWKFRESERIVGGPSTTQMEVPSHILAIMQGLFSHNLQFSPRPDGEIDIIPCIDVYPAHNLDSLIEDLETQLDGLRQFQARINDHMDEIKSVLTLDEGWTYDFLSQWGFDDACVWLECQRCGAFVLGSTIKKHHTCHDSKKGKLDRSTPRLLAAYTAARSARFEFGEKGR